MRITGFTGISGEAELDLSADVTVLVAANGFGKSTVCDAIAWAFTGEHPRAVDPRSLYSSTGETHVEVDLADSDGHTLAIRRTLIGHEPEKGGRFPSRLVVESDDTLMRGPQAEIQLASALLPPTSANSESATTTLVDGYYLQQESLREFLTGRSDDQRFSALSQMVGAGALSEVVKSFESSRTSWSRALKDLEGLVATANERADALRLTRENLAADLRERQDAQAGSPAHDWTSRATALLGADEASKLGAATAVDIEAVAAALRREAVRLAQLEESVQAALADVQIEIPARPREDFDESRLASARQSLAESEASFARATEEVEAARAEVARFATERQELATLAELALRHIGDSCPTCGQDVDREGLASRLRSMIDRAEDPAVGRRLSVALEASEVRLSDLNSARRVHAEFANAAREWNDKQRAYRAGQERLQMRQRRLAELLGEESYDDPLALLTRAAAALDDVGHRRGAVEELVNEGSYISSRFETSDVARRLAAIDSELEVALRERDELADRATRHRATSTVADILLKALRSDAEGFVNDRLRDIRPTLEHFYAAIDPHPTFRNVQLVTRNWYGKNRLDAVAVDESAGVRMTDPGHSLSTSQANAMAVAVFLAFNLGLSPTRLEAIVLDDPLQNLDDVHLLGMIDLLRRLSARRQMLITTHDRAYASLLARKLRPLGEVGRASLISISKWDRFGPRFETQEIERDAFPIKLASGE